MLFDKNKVFLFIETNLLNYSDLEDRLYLENFNYNKLRNYNSELPTFLIEFPLEERLKLEDYISFLFEKYSKTKLNRVYFKLYGDEDVVYETKSDGSKKKFKVIGLGDDITDRSFGLWLENGTYFSHYGFSLIEDKNYYLVREKDDLKYTSLIEIKDNYGNWIPTKIEKLEEEWSSYISLMCRYDKVRLIQ